jgi:hypothetical protein
MMSGLQIPLSCMQYVCTFAVVLKNILSITSDVKFLTERHRLCVVFEIMLISSSPMLFLAIPFHTHVLSMSDFFHIKF